MLRVRDLMSAAVVTVEPSTPLKEVARVLLVHDISGVPVVDADGGVVGVVSEGDFVAKEQGAASVRKRPLARIFGDSRETVAQLTKIDALSAGDAMSAPAIVIGPDAYITQAAALMIARGINRLPVIEGDKLVGIVSRADIVRAFASSDDEIVNAIRNDVVYHTLWLDPERFEIAVDDGVVRIAGEVERRSEAEMLERIVRMVPGVTDVHSELSWGLDDEKIKPPARDLFSPYERTSRDG